MSNDQYDNLTAQIDSYQDRFAGDKLIPSFAKLYSQYTRLSNNQTGLSGWNGQIEFTNRLNDAIKLINIGLYDKKEHGKKWSGTLKRAGEILEWLSHPHLNEVKLPILFLSAATYQLAGYPAMALGLLNNSDRDSEQSVILRLLLAADFPELEKCLQEYWSDYDFTNTDIPIEEAVLHELIRSVGIVSMYMRWGEDSRIDIVRNKLMAISKLQIYHEDPLSWLLARLCTELIVDYITNSLRSHTQPIISQMNIEGEHALENYLRNSFLAKKSLVWTSQIKGIFQLTNKKSFALCTPTGTGKTTIAELAIIKELFSKNELTDGLDWLQDFFPAPIAIYLVPSRALATEIEMKLNNIFRKIGDKPIKVTGLYGGIDWGPTDAWITSDERTVLVCTYEKAEALIRFLGPLFLSRVSLVVIDEAHSIQFDGKRETLITADNRSLRLEALSNRLLIHLNDQKSRVIALSAVAAGGSNTLAQWVSGDFESQAETASYRSTRQLIGRLNWNISGDYKIYYDVMNGAALRFNQKQEGENRPFIPRPFNSFPIDFSLLPKAFTGKGPSKKLRPYLVWAAIQMATKDESGNQSSVLVSITQQIGGYAKDFLIIIEKILKGVKLPKFFDEPIGENKVIWDKCVRSCEDYFGADSVEYKLLKMGVAVHYGNMPGLTARLLVEVINKKIVPIVLATSTLSEGINLPFETVIIPTLIRNRELLPTREFANLIGRAGRPGVATEGRTLIMLEENAEEWNDIQPKEHYLTMLEQILNSVSSVNYTQSPMAELMRELYEKWRLAFNSTDEVQFIKWLEDTIPLQNDKDTLDISFNVEEILDTFDGILLSSLVELELIDVNNISPIRLEESLKDMWKKSYAFYASSEKERLEDIFLKRGIAIPTKIYTNSKQRRRIYKTSLSPRYAHEVILAIPTIKQYLLKGEKYYEWNTNEKFEYILEIVRLIFSLKKFQVKGTIGKGKNIKVMDEVLLWWLDPNQTAIKPDASQLSAWTKYVNFTFTYQFNWGIGTVLSLILDEVYDGELIPTSLESWSDTELPWVVFWLKEMISWGTLDPVAAYLLARGFSDTRKTALKLAKEYYEYAEKLSNDVYNAVEIRNWVQFNLAESSKRKDLALNLIPIQLLRDFQNHSVTDWKVYPIIKQERCIWIDPAGYELAYSIRSEYDIFDLNKSDFILNYKEKVVRVREYLTS